MVIPLGSTIYVEEDKHNEFKMHERMALSEIPRRCNAYDKGRIVRTMQPASKTVSAFLNTEGGRIFLGVDDEGIAKGLRMSRTTRDHFMLSLHHCLNRFNPQVPADLIRVQFEEVVDVGKLQENAEKTKDDEKYVFSDGDDFDFDSDAGDDGEDDFEEFFISDHLVGGPRCDCQAANMGLARSKLYVIIIEVDKDPYGKIYQNDEGLAYRRCHGSNRMLSIEDLRQKMRSCVVKLEEKKPKNTWRDTVRGLVPFF